MLRTANRIENPNGLEVIGITPSGIFTSLEADSENELNDPEELRELERQRAAVRRNVQISYVQQWNESVADKPILLEYENSRDEPLRAEFEPLVTLWPPPPYVPINTDVARTKRPLTNVLSVIRKFLPDLSQLSEVDTWYSAAVNYIKKSGSAFILIAHYFTFHVLI